jgi:hypothetical protein
LVERHFCNRLIWTGQPLSGAMLLAVYAVNRFLLVRLKAMDGD